MQTTDLPDAMPAALPTERLLLRKPVTEDLADLYSIYSDIEVARWLEWSVLADKDALARDFDRYEKKWNLGEEFYWVIELTGRSQVVGSIACGVSGSNADIGFMLKPEHWGLGFATEAARSLLNTLVLLESIDRVVAVCAVENVDSARVLKSIGMQYKGTSQGFIVCPNVSDQARDALIFAVDCKT